jgi:hypothetical protein
VGGSPAIRFDTSVRGNRGSRMSDRSSGQGVGHVRGKMSPSGAGAGAGTRSGASLSGKMGGLPVAAVSPMLGHSYSTPPHLGIINDYFPDSSHSATDSAIDNSGPALTFAVAGPSRVKETPQAGRERGQSYDQTEEGLADKKRYRQTLMEVEDDRVFQQVLEDMVRLEAGHNVSSKAMGSSARPPIAESELGGVERGDAGQALSPVGEQRRVDEVRRRRETTQVWFVIRELLHGERRYGRLLARGVQVGPVSSDRDGY